MREAETSISAGAAIGFLQLATFAVSMISTPPMFAGMMTLSLD